MMPEFKRRDFLVFGSTSVGLTASANFAVSQTWSEKYQRSQASEGTKINVSGLEPGQQVVIKLAGLPIVVRYRTRAEIEQARKVLISDLIDTYARNANLPSDTPASDKNRTIDKEGKWFVYKPICTHLGAVTLSASPPVNGAVNWIDCPTHGGRFDAAGRVVAGPPSRNLTIPPARFVSANTIEIHSHNPFSSEQHVREAHPSEW